MCDPGSRRSKSLTFALAVLLLLIQGAGCDEATKTGSPAVVKASATTPPSGSIEFSPAALDFGNVLATTGVVKREVTVRNSTLHPIVLESVRSSCGCTTGSVTDSKLAPGAATVLTVSLTTSSREGPYSGWVTLRIGGGPSKEASLPVRAEFKAFASLEPTTLYFNECVVNQASEATVLLRAPRDTSVSVSSDMDQPDRALLKISEPVWNDEASSFEIAVTALLTEKISTELRATVHFELKSTDQTHKYTLPVRINPLKTLRSEPAQLLLLRSAEGNTECRLRISAVGQAGGNLKLKAMQFDQQRLSVSTEETTSGLVLIVTELKEKPTETTVGQSAIKSEIVCDVEQSGSTSRIAIPVLIFQ